MKRNTKSRGSGGRLRLALLLATAAAFMLVPAAQAFANGTMTVLGAGKGSGEVTSGNQLGFYKGTPPIACEYHGKTETTSGVCNDELSLEEELESTYLNAQAAAGSEFAGWIVVAGGVINLGCEAGENTCAPTAFEGEEPAFEVEAVFEPCAEGSKAATCHKPTLTVEIVGSGEGKVEGTKTAGVYEGKPKIVCNKPPKVGDVCENNMVAETAEEEEAWTGSRADALKATAAAGSTFAGWTVQKGPKLGGSGEALFCGPALEKATCLFALLKSEWQEGRNMKVTAVFNAKPKPQPLTLTTSGGGEVKEFKCKELPSGTPAACVSGAEFPEGSEIEVTAVPKTGSVFAEFTSGAGCEGASCVVTMSGPKSVNAKFNLASESFTAVPAAPTAEGKVECSDNGGGLVPCASSYLYGHTIKVVATQESGYVIGSLTGSGAALGTCDKEAGECEFTITGPSGVTAVFAGAKTIDSTEENVHGFVPETTELASTCELTEGHGDVDLGEFIPGSNVRHHAVCNLTVTATGETNVLRAQDLASSGEEQEGHLSQTTAHNVYNLPQPLEISSESTVALEHQGTSTNGELKPLPGGVPLMSYPYPVSKDNVKTEFSQWIHTHDALHKGVYSKTITLTLEQTEP